MLSTVVFLTLLVATTTQPLGLPYSLVFVEPEKGNTYQLRCTDKYGISVPNAVFFRDGAPNATDKTDCFQSLNDTGLGYIELSLTSECDGRFMCGVKSEMGFILSGPTEIIVAPSVRKTEKPMSIEAEEGQDVIIHCPFSESPLITYQIFLMRNKGGDLSIKDTVQSADNPNELILANLTKQDSGTYFCQLQTDTNLNGPDIDLEVHEKFNPPVFTSDLSYSAASGNDKTQFLVSASGTQPLHYLWEVNNTGVHNSTKDGQLLYERIGEGKTKVKVRISNQKYDGSQHWQEQLMYVDKEIRYNVVDTADSSVFSMSTASGKLNTALLILLITMAISLSGAVVLLAFCLLRKKRTQDKKFDKANDLVVQVGKHPITITQSSLNNIPEFLHKIDFIISSTVETIEPANLNPKVLQEVLDIKAMISSWNKNSEPSAAPDTESPTDLIPRGVKDVKPVTWFELLLPSLSRLLEKYK